VLVPFVKQIVPEVDVALGQLTLTPPAGLFELNLESGAKDEN
jgi:16S rRNA processing protein RimM